jgi:hypothetical protein
VPPKKLKSASPVRDNVVDLMPLPPPIQIPPELTEENDKQIEGSPDIFASISDHKDRKDPISIPDGDESQVITPTLHNHQEFVCVTIDDDDDVDDNEDELDGMRSLATHGHNSIFISGDDIDKDELEELPSLLNDHRELICVTIEDDSDGVVRSLMNSMRCDKSITLIGDFQKPAYDSAF